MSDDSHKWPGTDPFGEDDRTPPTGTPAPHFAQQPASPGFGNPPTGSLQAPVAFGNPPTGQFASPQFGNPPTGQFASPQFGNPPTGQVNTAQFGNPPTGQFASPQFGNPPTGQYSNPSTGQYSNPPSGQYSNPPSGQYSNPPSGQYSNPPSGQYSNPPTGQFTNPPTGQFGSPQTGQFGSVGVGTSANGQFPVDHRTPSDQFPAQSRPGQYVPGSTGSFDMPLVAPIATPPGMKAIQVVTPQMRMKYGGLGALFGLLVGLFLGILNSALESTSLVAGIPVTIQISCWFALLFGITCGTKPERIANVLRSYDVID